MQLRAYGAAVQRIFDGRTGVGGVLEEGCIPLRTPT